MLGNSGRKPRVALFPYTWSLPDWKEWTIVGEVASLEDLPGYRGMETATILTDWEACRRYQIKQSLECARQEGVIRTGLQEGDTFRCGTGGGDTVLYRLGFNGWEEYTPKATELLPSPSGRSVTQTNQYVVILPSMLGEHSAMETTDQVGTRPPGECIVCPQPKYLVTGRNAKHCHGLCLIHDGTDYWSLFDAEGAIRSGTGQASFHCIGIFSVLKIRQDTLYTYIVFCGDREVGSFQSNINMSINDQEGENFAHLYFYYGEEMTIFCCDGAVGSWSGGGDRSGVFLDGVNGVS
jgi:hypothetical protein